MTQRARSIAWVLLGLVIAAATALGFTGHVTAGLWVIAAGFPAYVITVMANRAARKTR